MLSLQSVTSAGYVTMFEANVRAMLLDHAHCEKKAASSALNMMFRYPDRPELVAVCADIVEEEIQHFRQVLQIMQARGWQYGRQMPSKYGGRLAAHLRTAEPHALLDRLLMCALIEARSSERFQLLGAGLRDPELATFYQALFESEARHYATYLKLALAYFDETEVRERLAFYAEQEAAICALGEDAPRLHA
jgi:tRNA-(ms[2]io[6]A)-hydroxylase